MNVNKRKFTQYLGYSNVSNCIQLATKKESGSLVITSCISSKQLKHLLA